MENAGGLGRYLAGRLSVAGESVVDVPPKLSARVRVLSTGNSRKNDGVDALNYKWSEGIHRFLLGQGTYQGIGDAYRNADGLFERIMDVLDLPSFGSA